MPSPRSAGTSDLSERLREAQHRIARDASRKDGLIELARAVSATLDPSRIAELAVDEIAAILPISNWALVATDVTGQPAVLVDRGVSQLIGPGLLAVARLVFHRGGDVALADVSRDARLAAAPPAALMAFALKARGDVVGALVGVDPRPAGTELRLSAPALAAVRLLLETPSAALQSALLLRRAEALSVSDDLTSVYNRRYLDEVLRRETKRASRTARPLSLLFLDLDGFKSINDSHGHLAGGRALIEAAAIVKRCARETDLVARFGGDEFAVVLPDTGSDGAVALAERVRDRIFAHRFLAADGLDIHLTASVGVATLPDVARSADELVKAADDAMYRVKDEGKNSIHVATRPTAMRSPV